LKTILTNVQSRKTEKTLTVKKHNDGSAKRAKIAHFNWLNISLLSVVTITKLLTKLTKEKNGTYKSIKRNGRQRTTKYNHTCTNIS